MFEFLTRCTNEILNSQSAAAPDQLGISSLAGEMWVVNQVVAYHDDAVAVDLSWRILGEGGKNIKMPIGVVAQNVRTRLGAYYTTPFLLAPDWTIYIFTTAGGNLSAGKKFYLEYHIHRIRGVAAGSLL